MLGFHQQRWVNLSTSEKRNLAPTFRTCFVIFEPTIRYDHEPRARSRVTRQMAFGTHRYFLSDDPMSVPLSMEDTR